MLWALIFMSTAKFPIPEYVELYQTRQECIAKLPKERLFFSASAYCAPIDNSKK